MRICSVHLENFRNFRRLDVDVTPSINVLFGENAQGKTNLIEAIYLCACARSHRTSKDRELILRGSDHYRVSLDISSDDKNMFKESVSLAYYDAMNDAGSLSKSKRIAEHNQVQLDRISQYIGLFNAVIFAPEDLLLIKEGPSVRRRYLDLLISQVRPRYFHDLQTYSKLLLQRNRALKNMRAVKGQHLLSLTEKAELEIWDLSMAPVSAHIISERITFSERIAARAKEHHSNISAGKETLHIRYRPVAGLISELSEAKSDEESRTIIENHLITKWKASQQEDFDKGNTGVGLHRDDLEMSLDGNGLRLFASQGQQRSAALALKLAELDILKEETEETPVLLLDDVFSELDTGRRTALLSNIGDAQVFITCTEKDFFTKELLPLRPDMFSGKDKIAFFRVENAEVSMEKK